MPLFFLNFLSAPIVESALNALGTPRPGSILIRFRWHMDPFLFVWSYCVPILALQSAALTEQKLRGVAVKPHLIASRNEPIHNERDLDKFTNASAQSLFWCGVKRIRGFEADRNNLQLDQFDWIPLTVSEGKTISCAADFK
jgi:hypothetical protein